MKIVWKYPIEVTDLQEVEMPQGSRILSVQVQKKLAVVGTGPPKSVYDPCIWALVNTEERKMIRRLFRIYGTGKPVDEPVESLNYVGTFQQGPFVWHVFERNVGKSHIRKVSK